MLLDEVVRGRLSDSCDLPGMHADPSFDNERTYARFLVTLFRAKLIRFDVRARCVCGVFCVRKKKAGSLRLVIDCRRSSALFKRPLWTPLGSLKGLSRVWLESQKEAYVAQEDIRDYFYRLGLDVRRSASRFCWRRWTQQRSRSV